MTPREVAQLVQFLAVAYPHHVTANQTTADAWQWLIGDLDGPKALAAVHELCRRPTPYPPSPGEVASAVTEAEMGPQPPDVDAATGYWLDGDLRHPLVKTAAGKVYWDKQNARSKAIVDFRALYAAELDRWRQTASALTAIEGGAA